MKEGQYEPMDMHFHTKNYTERKSLTVVLNSYSFGA